MKKTLIAVAALAATGAFAQSTVTLSGIMDAYYGIGQEYGQDVTRVNQSGARTTSFQFTGSEDLGGGMKANFRFEVQPSIIANNTGVATSTSVASGAAAGTTTTRDVGLVGPGYSFVGLSGKFGAVELGTINTATLSTFGIASQRFGTGVGSGYNTATYANLTRYEGSVAYKSNPFAGGFTARYQFVPNNNTTYGSTSSGVQTLVSARDAVHELGLSYAKGPLTAGYAYLQSLTNTTGLRTLTQTLAASYNFGPVSLGAGVQDQRAETTATTDNNFTVTSITAMVPMGANRLMANVGSRKRSTSVATNASIDGQTSTILGLAFERDLSKRTFVYARYEAADMKDTLSSSRTINGVPGTAASDTKRSLLAVGVSHAF